jgi:hypothetical protein
MAGDSDDEQRKTNQVAVAFHNDNTVMLLCKWRYFFLLFTLVPIKYAKSITTSSFNNDHNRSIEVPAKCWAHQLFNNLPPALCRPVQAQDIRHSSRIVE